MGHPLWPEVGFALLALWGGFGLAVGGLFQAAEGLVDCFRGGEGFVQVGRDEGEV